LKCKLESIGGRGLFTGEQGVRWSFLLNIPYVIIPIVSAVRFLRQQDSHPDLASKPLSVSITLTQGAYRSWKVMEIKIQIFQAWKVMKSDLGHGKS